MPARKSIKKAASKKGAKKPVKRRAAVSKRPLQEILEEDPPIIVGGGGSAFIWIKKAISTLVDPSTIPATAPQPADPSAYYIYRCNRDIRVAIVSRGSGIPTNHSNMNPRTHVTIFDA